MERGNKMKSLARVMCLQSICALLAILFLLNLPLAAQDATGRIVGVVTDPAGSVVPKAKVTVTSVGTGVSSDTLAGEDGSYQVLLLPIGSYRVSAEAPGFRKTVTNPEKLDINQSLKIDLKLEIGATTESVQVEANATAVETVTAALGASVTTADPRPAPERPQCNGSGDIDAGRDSGRGGPDAGRRQRLQYCRGAHRFHHLPARWRAQQQPAEQRSGIESESGRDRRIPRSDQ